MKDGKENLANQQRSGRCDEVVLIRPKGAGTPPKHPGMTAERSSRPRGAVRRPKKDTVKSLNEKLMLRRQPAKRATSNAVAT